MKARYRTVCPRCRQKIKIGAAIVQMGSVWMHESCKPAQIRMNEKIRATLRLFERAGFR